MSRPARAAEILPRVVEAETLDSLEPDDPAAQRSRRDLLRVNRVMGASRILAAAMRAAMAGRMPTGRPLRVLEIGCGDGDLLLAAVSGLKSWPKTDATLLDRVSLVDFETRRAFSTRGWLVRTVTADVFQWANAPSHWPRFDLIVANLFLHHFDAARLAALFGALAPRCDAFVACEPRRVRLALAASHLVGAIGANAVTRKDAVLSVRAGFVGQEISALWPRSAEAGKAAAGDAEWQCREYSAGLFSHVFVATRTGPLPEG
ncbi:MAG TPA: methyltransferase domain-containing protein [Caldimonas sp.]|jgi:SAM-dependent methyltransferase|nr:methyltransferase domain-containing protein [Caldimonas sp.]HEX2540523.1 methyltransferase domain-containing protein [Caldimonas sp.]